MDQLQHDTKNRRIELTAARIAKFTCPSGRQQAFLFDAKAPGLAVRATATGSKSYVLETKIHSKSARITIGSTETWGLNDARERARELRVLVDKGIDPRELARVQRAEREAARALKTAQKTTLGEAWAAYVDARKSSWGDLHLADHIRLSQAGGKPAARGTRGRNVTVAGPLHELMAIRIVDVTPAVLEAWAKREVAARPTKARLAHRLLRAFFSWLKESGEFKVVAPATNPAAHKALKELLGKSAPKNDALLREQLKPWFTAVQALPNATIKAYLLTTRSRQSRCHVP